MQKFTVPTHFHRTYNIFFDSRAAQVCQNNDLTNQIALQQEVDNMTRLIAQIVAVCNDDAPKPYANFSHEIITHGLDSLADAVQTGSAAAAVRCLFRCGNSHSCRLFLKAELSQSTIKS
jgi:hypothetical protein